LKKNVVKKILPLVMALLQGIKNLFGPLLMTWNADSPTRRYGSRRLPDSLMRGVVDSQLPDTGSRFSITNISTNSNSKASVRDLC
jgi:hypothetical protein